MRALGEWVEHLLADDAEAEDASSALEEALGSPDEAVRERAAGLLIDALALASPLARARIFYLLQAAWWPPSATLAPRAHAATSGLLPQVEEDGPELEDGILLWAHLSQVNRELLPKLVAGLEDPAWAIRRTSAGALGRLGEDGSPHIPLLVERLSDPDERVGAVALESLSALAAQDMERSLPALHAEIRNRQGARRFLAMSALRGLMEDAADRGAALPPEQQSLEPSLLAALEDEAEGVRMQAVGLLGLRKKPGKLAAAALERALSDQSADVRSGAAAALLRLGRGKVGVQVLQQLLCSPSPEVHQAAFTALDPLTAAALAGARPALEAAVSTGDPSVEQNARALLARLG